MIITIDGPAGAGKSSVARELAKRLGFEFLDTGAMYRAVAWACVDSGIDLDDQNAIARVANDAKFEFAQDSVRCNDRDITELIRSQEASIAASIVAAVPAVRNVLVRLQREASVGRNLVTEGRDQGSVVFPDAECKFFLTAAPEVRARRRLRDMQMAQNAELGDQRQAVSDDLYNEVLKQIIDRDERDRARKISPLVKADDAIEVDTSALSQPEVIDVLEDHAKNV